MVSHRNVDKGQTGSDGNLLKVTKQCIDVEETVVWLLQQFYKAFQKTFLKVYETPFSTYIMVSAKQKRFKQVSPTVYCNISLRLCVLFIVLVNDIIQMNKMMRSYENELTFTTLRHGFICLMMRFAGTGNADVTLTGDLGW